MTDFTNQEALSAQDQGVEAPKQEGNEAPKGEGGEESPVLELGGRKYTREDLEKKIVNQDSFIEQLKQERQEDRKLLNDALEELKKATDTRDLVNKVKQQPNENQQVIDNTNQPQQQKEPQSNEPSFSQEDIQKLVDQRMESLTKAQQAEANWNNVTGELTKAYGQRVNDAVKEVAEDNGFTLDEAVEFAKSKPKAFLKLFPELNKPTPVQRSGNAQDFNTQGYNSPPPKNQHSQAYWKARTTRDQVSAYLQRLRELSS